MLLISWKLRGRKEHGLRQRKTSFFCLPAETEVVLVYRPRFKANISSMQLRSVTVRANLYGLIEST